MTKVVLWSSSAGDIPANLAFTNNFAATTNPGVTLSGTSVVVATFSRHVTPPSGVSSHAAPAATLRSTRRRRRTTPSSARPSCSASAPIPRASMARATLTTPGARR